MEYTHELRMKHVLLVDDDAEMAAALKALLEANDFMVSWASNGVDALKVVMDLEVDAVLCDLMMPKMPGDMFYLAVERVKPQVCQRFIFITGYENHPKFGPFLKNIQAVVLYKPVTMGKLMGTLNVLFKKQAEAKKKNASQKLI